MPSIYKADDVFVLPSKRETWGLVVNETTSSENPVIVSDRCGCARDLFQKGINGFVFKGEDRNDVNDKLKNMSEAKKLFNSMDSASIHTINNYSFSHIWMQ